MSSLPSASLSASPPFNVESRLRIPKLLSLPLPAPAVLVLAGVEVSIILSVAMKKVVGAPLPGSTVGVVASGSAKLCLRGCTGRASPPTRGRMVACRK